MKNPVQEKKISIVASLILLWSIPVYILASGTGDHNHDKGHHAMDAGLHKHDKWETPPNQYAGLKISSWADKGASARGQVIYDKNCLSCHGVDGKGKGPLAKNLPHPPADLTNHFHRKPGDGDGYLFWRVSEGGLVEPFKSMQSAMPPFKSSLDKNQRWDVLIYIHNKFHGGFLGSAKKKGGSDSHDQHH